MTNTSIVAFSEERAGYHPRSDIYDPILNPAGKVIAKVKQLVLDDLNGGAQLLWVTEVDPVTKQPSYDTAEMRLVEKDALTRIVSYGNDIHRVYLDSRTNPASLRLDTRLIFFGSDNAQYRLVRKAGTAAQEIVSRYYDADGKFTSNFLPMVRVAPETNSWWCTNGHTTADLADGEELQLQVFNSAGAMVATAVVFVKPATVLNELPGKAPVITDLRVTASQMRGNGEIFIYENQALEALNLQVTVTYDDGREVTSPIDNTKVFLFGLENFMASYPGLKQPFLVRWYLASDEAAAPGLTSTKHYIAIEQSLVVVPNELVAGIKLSTVPVWNGAMGRYELRFFLYSTDRDDVMDVTTHITVTPAIDGGLYGVMQQTTLSCNLRTLFPLRFTDDAPYQQRLAIQLQPYAALQRYILTDSTASTVIYGVDSPSVRRPRLYYDNARQQYFIPSTVFTNTEAMLTAFYHKASPPYLADSETGPITPSHFLLRDPWSGLMLTTTALPLSDFAAAFSIIGAQPGRLVGNTVLVEFVKPVDAETTLVLYGVPADVYNAPSGYLGP